MTTVVVIAPGLLGGGTVDWIDPNEHATPGIGIIGDLGNATNSVTSDTPAPDEIWASFSASTVVPDEIRVPASNTRPSVLIMAG